MFGQRKSKKKPTNKVISEILKQKRGKNKPVHEKLANLINFIETYHHDNFEDILAFFFNDADVLEYLPQNIRTDEKLLNSNLYDKDKVSLLNTLIIYKLTILKYSEEVLEFEEARKRVESFILIGNIDAIEKNLDYLDQKYGVTIWSINLRGSSLYLKNSDKDYYDAFQYYVDKNNNRLLLDTLQSHIAKLTATDTTLYVKNDENRKVKELIDGGAFDLAAYFSLLSGVFPLDYDIDLLYCLPMLHHFQTYDMFNYIYLSLSTFLISYKIEDNRDVKNKNIVNHLSSFVSDINKKIPNTRFFELGNLVATIKDGEPLPHKREVITDEDYENYCSGEYDKLIDHLELHYADIINLISKVNIYAKSYIRSGRNPSKILPKLLYETLTDLIKIYKLENSTQAIKSIMSNVYKFNHFELSHHLLIALAKAAPYQLDKKNLKVLGELGGLITTPVTPLVKSLSERLTISPIYQGIKKSEYLTAKDELCFELLKNSMDDNKIQQHLEKIRSINPIKKDYVELLIEYYVKSNNIVGLLEFSTNELIKNHESIICFPLDRISMFIDENNHVSIDSVIIAYFYNSEKKMKNEDFLRDCFEDYIISKEDKRPSEILDCISELSDKEIYFYQHICQPRLLSYQGCYSGGTSEINDERVKILTALYSKFEVNNEEIDLQLKGALDEVTISEGLKRISKARIKLNIPELIKCKSHDINSLMNLYHKDEEALEEEDYFFTSKYLTDSGEKGFIAKGSKHKIVNKIINTLRVEFLDNPDFGLDKLLSSTIRHSFFNDEVSIKPLEKELISELDKYGSFEKKTYWLDKYSYVNAKAIGEVVKQLDIFNKDFNDLIEKAESWMKVSWTDENPERVFSFPFFIDIDDYKKINDEVKLNEDPIKVANLICKIFVAQLEEKLAIIRSKLNGSFASEMDTKFQTLIDNINSAKSGLALTDLINDVDLVKNGIKEDIKTTCEWFYINKKEELVEDISISKVIQISERFLQKSPTNKNNIEIVYNCDFLVQSSHTSTLCLCLINIFTNAYKYSKPNSNITLIVNESGNIGFSLDIINEISEERRVNLVNGGLEAIIKKLMCKESIQLLKTEGGTGLYKSAYDLNLASSRYKLAPFLLDSKFIVRIDYDETNINC